MGIGFYLSRERRVTGEVRIQHYSNGNLFSQNPWDNDSPGLLSGINLLKNFLQHTFGFPFMEAPGNANLPIGVFRLSNVC